MRMSARLRSQMRAARKAVLAAQFVAADKSQADECRKCGGCEDDG
jgi:hypothetical protein